MTPDIRRALDSIEKALPQLRAGGTELARRAKISSRKDGYPVRASGAQPGTITTPREVFTTSTFPWRPDGSAWGWKCSCGEESAPTSPAPSSFVGIGQAQQHYDDLHGSVVVSYADPTGETVASPGASKPDPVELRHARFIRQIVNAEHAIEVALAQLREPSDVDDNTAWCAACATIRHDDGTPYLTPPDGRVKGASDVNGRLKSPMILCRWHRDWVANEGALPDRKITTEYVTRGRVAKVRAS